MPAGKVTSQTGHKQGPWAALCNQQGGFSPFLFGLVVGMSIFSALSMQWAKQDLAAYQKQQEQRVRQNADEVAKGLDFAILTETGQNYSEKYDLDRARTYSASQGVTRGGQNYMVAAQGSNRTQFEKKATTVAITGSDDTLLRSEVYRAGSEEELLQRKQKGSQAVTVYDTSMARDRQVRTSNQRMELLAEQVYAFYAGKYRFPTESEFETLKGRFNIRDVWGGDFLYRQDKTGQKATLSFTTPWDYTQTLNLSLKDDATSSNNTSNTTSAISTTTEDYEQ